MEKVTLIFSDLSANSYKTWKGELHDDGRVISHYGALGAAMQTKDYGHKGRGFFDKKIQEKLRKGYVHAKVVDGSADTSSPVPKGTLAEIAVSQIKVQNEAVKALIRRLADANVHKITSLADIKFDVDAGVFQTPLGVVTQEGIDDARNLLSWLNLNRKENAEYKRKVDAYLRVVPRNKIRGMSYSIFASDVAIQNELALLDSLESSLEIIAKPKTAVGDKPAVAQVFNLHFDVADDDKERRRLEEWFHKSKKRMHNYDRVQVKEIYAVDIIDYNSKFRKDIGNVVEVYHGSGQSNILSILKSGIRTSPPNTAQIAGKLFGNGIYGSQTSSKAMGYTFGRWGQPQGDSGWLFVCDFAMGKAYYPKSYGLNGVPAGYDSCWALPEKTGLHNDELIVYNEFAVKIKYLMEIK